MGKRLLIIFCLIVFNIEAAERIVSLAPNITETIYALKKSKELVGVTTYCDFPKEALLKPKVGTYERPNIEKIIMLKPTLVILTKGNPSTLQGRLEALNIKTYYHKTGSIKNLPNQIVKLSQIVGAKNEGDRLATKLKNSFKKLRESAKSRGQKSYLYLFSVAPMVSLREDTIIGELFKLAGYKNILPKKGTPYPQVSPEWLHANRPGVVVLDDTNLKESIVNHLKRGYSLKNFMLLPKDIFMRPGPRLIEAARFLQREGKE